MSVSENVTVGDIETKHQLLEVTVVSQEGGSLIYEDYMEFDQNKHTLDYQYDVNFSEEYILEEKELIVFTNNTKVSIISYDNIMVTNTAQRVNVEIGLNTENTHEKDEQIDFTLIFNVTGNQVTEEEYSQPPEETSGVVVYDMDYTPANNVTFDDLPLEFYSVILADNKVIFDNSSSKILYTADVGTVQIDLGSYESGSQTGGVIKLNGQIVDENSSFNPWTVELSITENNSIIEIIRKQYNTVDMYVNEIRYIE